MTAPIGCPACGAPNTSVASFCGACGASLRPPTVPPAPCRSCGTPNPPGQAYCSVCGQPLTGPSRVAAGPAVATGSTMRSPIIIALAIVLMVFLGIASAFLVLTLMDGRDGGVARGGVASPSASPSPTVEPVQTPAPDGTITPRPRRTPQPTPTLGPPGSYGCVSDPTPSVVGPAGSNWNLVRVDFRTYRDFDRVIYQLRRSGDDDDDTEPTVVVRHDVPGEGEFIGSPPYAPDSEWRLNVLLVKGIRDRAGLNPPYEPRGMRIVDALSTQRYQSHVNYYPVEDEPHPDPYMVDVGVLSQIDVTGDGCHALRVVGWDGEGDSTASVYVDIRH